MKISFWITAVVLFCAVRQVFPNNLRVGTVLFTTTDIVKKCWAESDKALLRARFIMQDVLPEPDCIILSKPGVYTILLEYFQSCYEIISSSTYGKAQNLMFLALSDAVGGYLRGYALPIAKRAYYAGQAKYSEVGQLFQLYKDIKKFLKTNGMGWAEPCKLCPLQTLPKPLVISSTGGQEACDNLYLIEKKTKFHFNKPQKIKSNLCVKTPTRSEDKNQQPQTCEESKPVVSDVSKPTTKELQQLQDMMLPNTTNETLTEVSTNCGESFTESSTDPDVRVKRKRDHKRQWKRSSHNESMTDKTLEDGLQKEQYSEDVKEDSVGFYRNESRLQGSEDEDDNERLNSELENSMMGCYTTVPNDELENKVMVPLPVLDDSVTPFTLAVPFKNQPLRSIRSRSSAFVLEHYYVSVIKCMINKRSSEDDVKQFNAHFSSWMDSKVYPHLDDEVWYPAFGGVLRIAETIKKLGSDSSIKEPIFNDVGYMFPERFRFDDMHVRSGKEKARDVTDVTKECENDNEKSRRYITYAILLSALGILFLFLACVFCLQSYKSHNPPIKIACKHKKKPHVVTDHTLRHLMPGSGHKIHYEDLPFSRPGRKVVRKTRQNKFNTHIRAHRRDEKPLKRVFDWKNVTEMNKGGGDRLPLFKFPWTFVQKTKQEKCDLTDIDGSSSKCLVNDSESISRQVNSGHPQVNLQARPSPIWPSQAPCIAQQGVGSAHNIYNTETSTPMSTDANQELKFPSLRNHLNKIQLIWQKPTEKPRKTNNDKDTKDCEKPRKTPLNSTIESSKKKKELLKSTSCDTCTLRVEDEKRYHHKEKRSTSYPQIESCPMSSGTPTSSCSETQETSSIDSEAEIDEWYSSESDSSRRTTN